MTSISRNHKNNLVDIKKALCGTDFGAFYESKIHPK
jgi:hypothetical protein